MKSSTESQVQNLSEGLEIATKGLVAPAKQRISTEIEVHYAEAVDAHLKTGQGEADAQTAGLKELGDAKAASKGFRRRHLTEREAKRLEQIGIRSKSVSAMITDFWHFALVLYLARSVDLPGRR